MGLHHSHIYSDLLHWMDRARAPRYRQYGVYDAHTGELLSAHDTRSEANAHKKEHSHRVRGVCK
jgi:hypothetical protein